MAGKGCPGFVVKFNTYNNSTVDPMSFTSLLQGEPQIFSSEIGRDCTYIHIIVNKLGFINNSNHQLQITGWSFIGFILEGFIRKYVLKQDIWVWHQSNIWISDIGRPEFNMARSAQIFQYLHICIKMLYLMTLCYM